MFPGNISIECVIVPTQLNILLNTLCLLNIFPSNQFPPTLSRLL